MKQLMQLIGLFAILGIFMVGCESVVESDHAAESPPAPGYLGKPSNNNTIIVSDNNLGVDWTFVAESGGGSGEFVIGPDSPPIGKGSAEISLTSGIDGYALLGFIGLGGTPLEEIEALTYSTYRSIGNPAWAISLQFAADYDGSGDWQGRLVFEPYYTETVETGEWQTWDPLTQGRWWGTGGAGASECPINDPCSWDDVLTNFPGAVIRDDDGPIIFKAGSGWGEFVGNVDGITITINGETKTYNFEASPTTKDDCKKGGWQNYGFRNQGLCIQYVNTGKDSR